MGFFDVNAEIIGSSCSNCFIWRPKISKRNGNYIKVCPIMKNIANLSKPFNKGNSKNQGVRISLKLLSYAKHIQIIPHTTSQNCKGYTSRIISFCDSGDPFCDSGQEMGAHIGVVSKHMEEAKAFILNKIRTLSVPVRADA